MSLKVKYRGKAKMLSRKNLADFESLKVTVKKVFTSLGDNFIVYYFEDEDHIDI